jgi:hypothetical protein
VVQRGGLKTGVRWKRLGDNGWFRNRIEINPLRKGRRDD